MAPLPGDPTILALRTALDTEYRTAGGNASEHVADRLGCVVLACLPHDVFKPVFLTADGATSPSLAITFKPLFRRYMAYAAEYWASLIVGHDEPAPDREKQTVA